MEISHPLVLKEDIFWPILTISDHRFLLEWFADINKNPYPHGCP